MSGAEDSTQKLIIAGAVALAAVVGGVVVWKTLRSGGNASSTVAVPVKKAPRQKRVPGGESSRPDLVIPEVVTDVDVTGSWTTFEDLKQRLRFKHPETFTVERNASHPVCMYRLVDTSQAMQSEEESVMVIIEYLMQPASSREYFEKSKQLLVMMNQMMAPNPGFAILEERHTKLGDLDAFEIEYTQVGQNPTTGQFMHMRVYNLMYAVDNRGYCVHYSNQADRFDPTFAKQVTSTITVPEAPVDHYSVEYHLPEYNLVVPFPSYQYYVDTDDKSGIVTIVHSSEKDAKATRIVISRPESKASIQDIAAEWSDKIKKANPNTPIQQEEITLADASTPAVKLSYMDTTDRKCVSVVFYLGDLPFVATGFAADEAEMARIQKAILNIRAEPQHGDRSQPFLQYRNTEYGFSMDVDPSLHVLQADFGETVASFLTNVEPTDPEELIESAINIRTPATSGQTYDAKSMMSAVLDEVDEMRQSGSDVEILEQKTTTMGGLPGFHIMISNHMEGNQMQGPIDMVYHITCCSRNGQLISVRSITTKQNFSKMKASFDAMANSFAFF